MKDCVCVGETWCIYVFSVVIWSNFLACLDWNLMLNTLLPQCLLWCASWDAFQLIVDVQNDGLSLCLFPEACWSFSASSLTRCFFSLTEAVHLHEAQRWSAEVMWLSEWWINEVFIKHDQSQSLKNSLEFYPKSLFFLGICMMWWVPLTKRGFILATFSQWARALQKKVQRLFIRSMAPSAVEREREGEGVNPVSMHRDDLTRTRTSLCFRWGSVEDRKWQVGAHFSLLLHLEHSHMKAFLIVSELHHLHTSDLFIQK